jgi:hypothetical protein
MEILRCDAKKDGIQRNNEPTFQNGQRGSTTLA